jgi:outer membrane receptor protein involved in Fe transport
MTTSIVSVAVRSALLAAAVGSVPALAFAQAATSDTAGEASLDEIVVTGSRIAQTNLDSPTLVTALTVADLQGASGAVSLGDALNDLPALRGTFTSANSTRFIGTAGVNFLDLRGLGTARTLVLVNGRRHVAGTDGSLEVDTNTIPIDLIERVDVVTGGASSIYGSDAIAGVVNFVTKTDFEGLQFSAQSGASTRGDNPNSFASLTGGLNFADGRGNVAGSLEWAKEQSYDLRDRETTRVRNQFNLVQSDPAGVPSDGIPDREFFGDTRSLYLTNGGTFIASFQPGAVAGVPASVRNRPENGQPRIWRFVPGGGLQEANYGTRDFRPLANNSLGGDGATLREYGMATPDITRSAVNVLGSFEFTEAAQVFGEAKFVRTSTYSLTSPSFNQSAATTTTFPGAVGSGGLRIRLTNPYLSAQARTLLTSLLPANATEFVLNRNNLDLGVRGEDTDRDTMRFVVGVKGEILPNLSYEVSGNYGRTDVSTNVLGNRYERQFRLAVDAARAADGSIQCRSRLNASGVLTATGDPVVDACVPVNVLGFGDVSDAARGYITAPSTFEAKVTQTVGNAYVAYDTRDWFELPGGGIGAALGVEYRKETTDSEYSSEVRQGLTFLNAIQPLEAEYTVKEWFAELRFPLLANLPFVEELTVTGSYRQADYDLPNTSKVDAWGAGLTWTPIGDVRFRASLSKSVRAPTLADLYQPLTQNFASVNDPCDVNFISQGSPTRAANCAAAGIPAGFVNSVARSQTIEIRSGGNPGLIEEDSRSVTAGFVLQPRFLENFSLTADYYDIRVNNVIASVTVRDILNNCYDAASLNNAFCPLIFRDPATNLFYANGNGPIGGGVLQGSLNYASRRARGIDAETAYRYDAGFGEFRARWYGTYTLQRDNFPFIDQPNRPNQILEELGDPKFAWNASLDFIRGPVTVTYGVRWLGTQYFDFIENVREVGRRAPENPDWGADAWTGHVAYHDVRVGWDMLDNLNVYAGIDNIGDKLPPLGLTGTGEGSGIYSLRGRYVYAGLKYKM